MYDHIKISSVSDSNKKKKTVYPLLLKVVSQCDLDSNICEKSWEN